MKIWEKLSSKYIDDKKKVIADFSCYKYRDQCKLMNIKNVPSIYAFYGPDSFIRYKGKHSLPIVDEWIRKMSSFPVKNISSINEITQFMNNNSSLVAFLSTRQNDFKQFYETAYFRNSSNVFLFLEQNETTENLTKLNRITAFLNSNFSVSSNNQDLIFKDFVWKNQFHVPFQLTIDNIVAAKTSKDYLAVYITKLKKKKLTAENENNLKYHNLTLYNQLKYLGEMFYEKANFCWSDIRKFSLFFKNYGISKAPAFLVFRDDLFWMTKTTDVEYIASFMNQIINGDLIGEKVSKLKIMKYDILRVLMRYPILIFLFLMLLSSLFIIIYFINIHMKRLRSFSKFSQSLKSHSF